MCVSAPTASMSVKVRSLSMLVEPLGAQTFLPARSFMPVIGAPLSVVSPSRTSTFWPER